MLCKYSARATNAGFLVSAWRSHTQLTRTEYKYTWVDERSEMKRVSEWNEYTSVKCMHRNEGYDDASMTNRWSQRIVKLL